MGVTFDFLKSMFHPYGGTTNFIDVPYQHTSASTWTTTVVSYPKKVHYHAARPAKRWR